MTSPGRAAWDAYRAAVSGNDAAGVEGLFAPDAVAENPFGTLTGRDAVLGFYDHVIDVGEHCVHRVVELDGTTPATAEVQDMVDLFTVGDDGRVTRLSISWR